jgi:hypothetical protein
MISRVKTSTKSQSVKCFFLITLLLPRAVHQTRSFKNLKLIIYRLRRISRKNYLAHHKIKHFHNISSASGYCCQSYFIEELRQNVFAQESGNLESKLPLMLLLSKFFITFLNKTLLFLSASTECTQDLRITLLLLLFADPSSPFGYFIVLIVY